MIKTLLSLSILLILAATATAAGYDPYYVPSADEVLSGNFKRWNDPRPSPKAEKDIIPPSKKLKGLNMLLKIPRTSLEATVQQWQQNVAEAARYENYVRNFANSGGGAAFRNGFGGSDPLGQAFNQKYPGSTINMRSGGGIWRGDDNRAIRFRDFDVIKVDYPNGTYTETWDFDKNLAMVEGPGGKVVVSMTPRPHISYAMLPNMTKDASSLMSRFNTVDIKKNAIVDLLNDVWYTDFGENKIAVGREPYSLINFAFTVLTNYDERKAVLVKANEIYGSKNWQRPEWFAGNILY